MIKDVESTVEPKAIEELQGKKLVNFNVETVDRDGIEVFRYKQMAFSIDKDTEVIEKEVGVVKGSIAKASKESNLATITVTTEAGNTFDGNDKAINRMMAAIQASAITGITETKWVLADNSNVMVTLDELKEALVLSIQAIGNEVTE